MAHQQNTAYVTYRLTAGEGVLRLLEGDEDVLAIVRDALLPLSLMGLPLPAQASKTPFSSLNKSNGHKHPPPRSPPT